MRNGREIYYDVIPRMFPSPVDIKPDRFIGVEVSFPASLDEYFQVRHVKRGAEPVNKLREEIRKFLEKPIKEARRRIRERWDKTAVEEQQSSPKRGSAIEAYKRMGLAQKVGMKRNILYLLSKLVHN